MPDPVKNAFVVIDAASGHQLMRVIDADDVADPAWNPPGSVQITIPLDVYETLSPADLDAWIVNAGAGLGMAVQPTVKPDLPAPDGPPADYHADIEAYFAQLQEQA